MDSCQEKDGAAAGTPSCVSLESIRANISSCSYLYPNTAPHMTIAVVVMINGYVIVGSSCPTDPDNFDMDKGQEIALTDCLKQAQALEAYVHRTRDREGW